MEIVDEIGVVVIVDLYDCCEVEWSIFFLNDLIWLDDDVECWLDEFFFEFNVFVLGS